MSMFIGEGLVGEGNEIAHIDLLIGARKHHRACGFGETGSSHDDEIGPRRRNVEREPAIGPGLHGRLTTCPDAAKHDARARQHGTGDVSDHTRNGGGICRRGGQQCARTEDDDRHDPRIQPSERLQLSTRHPLIVVESVLLRVEWDDTHTLSLAVSEF